MLGIKRYLSHCNEIFGKKPREEPYNVSKVVEIFRDSKISTMSNYVQNPIDKKKFNKTIVGGLLGFLGSCFSFTTGASTALHEVVGHGNLGLALTSNVHPSYQIDGFDNFQDMTHQHSFVGGVTSFFHWLSGYDAPPKGSSGTTSYGSDYGINGLGKAMGSHGENAWVSITGCLPALFLDSLLVASGMHLRKRSPTVGGALIGFGAMDNLINATYPISAAVMDKNQMEKSAESGHDFANFSIEMHEITGIPAQDIAITTAAFWVSFVPLVAVLAYMHTKSGFKNAIPDVMALKHWVENLEKDPQASEKLKVLYRDYPKRKLLEKLSIRQLQSSPLFPHFFNYLLENLPVEEIEKSKNSLLSSYNKNLPKDRIQQVLTGFAVVGIISAVVSKVLAIVSLGFSSVEPAATILGYISPVFLGAAIASSAYQVYKDFQCPDHLIPKTAKMIAIAKLVMTVVCAALVISALVTPGVNLLFVGSIFSMCVLNILLSYAHSKVVEKQFARNLARSPEVWSVMYEIWWKRYHANAPMVGVVRRWIDHVK